VDVRNRGGVDSSQPGATNRLAGHQQLMQLICSNNLDCSFLPCTAAYVLHHQVAGHCQAAGLLALQTFKAPRPSWPHHLVRLDAGTPSIAVIILFQC